MTQLENRLSPFQRMRRLWPHLYAILGSFALLVTLGHVAFIWWAQKPFESFWKLPFGSRALLVFGLAAFEQVLALGLSLGLAVLLGIFPYRLRLFRGLHITPVALLFALGASVSLLLLCFSHASNLYLGSFMDLPLMVNVLLQIQQWFSYSHHNDPRTLYSLLAGGSVLVGVFAWLLGQPQEALQGRPGRAYLRSFASLSRWARWPAISSVAALGLSLVLLDRLKLDNIFAARLAPELYLVSRLLERLPDPPSEARYTPRRRQIPMKQFAAGVPAAPKRNVIVLEIESWSPSRTGFHGAPRPVTPNLDRLSRRSLVLPNTIAVSSHSEYAQMAILSSLHPLKYPYHDPYRRIEYPRVLLHNVLAAFGYRTAMFSSQDERWQNNVNFLYNGDWDVFWFSKNFPGPHYGHGFERKILDEYTVAEAIPWLRGGGKPFFAYLNFQRTHHPYAAPRPWDGLFTPSAMTQPWSFHYWPPDILPIAQNRFDNSLRYVDAQVGKLVEALHSSGLEQNTILLIIGDHGENIGPGAPPPHCCRLVLEEINTPLLIYAPGLVPETVDQRVVATIDIPPTIAGLLRVAPHPAWQGVDVLAGDGKTHPPIRLLVDNIVLMDGVIEWPLKLVANHSHRTMSMTNLLIDPYETRDLLEGTQPGSEVDQVARRMLKSLQSFRNCQIHFYGSEALFRNFYPTCE